MARRFAVVMSQAPGLSGTPDSGQRSSAATSASCARSSARPTSPTMRVSPAMTLADSIRHTASMARWVSDVVTASPRSPRFSWGEELLEYGGERGRRYVVGLTGERAQLRARDDLRELLGCLAQHRHALVAADHEGRHPERGCPPGWQREVSHDRRVVLKRWSYGLELGPHR